MLGDEAISPDDDGVGTFCSDDALNERFVEGKKCFENLNQILDNMPPFIKILL